MFYGKLARICDAGSLKIKDLAAFLRPRKLAA
jgi:hypothetical protein